MYYINRLINRVILAMCGLSAATTIIFTVEAFGQEMPKSDLKKSAPVTFESEEETIQGDSLSLTSTLSKCSNSIRVSADGIQSVLHHFDERTFPCRELMEMNNLFNKFGRTRSS